MKEYLAEIGVSTIVATIVTLLFYIIGMDHSWDDAAQTFGMCFLVSIVVGIYMRQKKARQE